MSQNLELKAKLADISRTDELARENFGQEVSSFHQRDTYFRVQLGRLKLRESPELGDELIFYSRPDEAQAKLCNYWRQPTMDAEAMKQRLAETCGIEVVVDKQRTLIWYENVRIHLDRVNQLGGFLELEAIISEDDSETDSAERIAHILTQLEMENHELIDRGYRELLLAAQQTES